MKLEEMGSFFESRLAEYEAHMLDCIDSARDHGVKTVGCDRNHPGRKMNNKNLLCLAADSFLRGDFRV